VVRSSCWSNYRTNGQQFPLRPVGSLSQCLVTPLFLTILALPLQSNQWNLVKGELLIPAGYNDSAHENNGGEAMVISGPEVVELQNTAASKHPSVQ